MNTLITDPTKQFASMDEVVMKKSELLTYLIENKAKHDVILTTAIAGYWEIASAKIEEKREKLIESVSNWKEDVNRELDKVQDKINNKQTLPKSVNFNLINISSDLGLVYPQDHSREYERAIRMMKSSVYDEVRLTVEQYDAYVLNNWEWKQNFNASNLGFVNSYKARHNNTMLSLSGYAGPQGPQGIQGLTEEESAMYSKAATTAVSSYSQSNNVSL
jgi:gas vesicle protein